MNEQLNSSNAWNALKKYYSCVLWQDFSPDSNYLLVACRDGRLYAFNINETLNAYEDESRVAPSCNSPEYSFQAHESAVYSFTWKDEILISGGKGEIKGWSLPDEIEKPLWTIDIPKSEALFKPEVNALLIGEQESDPFLVAGCGDNMIHIFSLQSHKPKQTLKGHTDYVNCLALSPDSRTLYSGSEDGSIRIWDLRSASVVNSIEPHKYQELNRAAFGKYITTIALNSSGEWLVSGGGPLMSSWHLRSLSKGIEFETPPSETVANTALCHNDLVVCGGNNPYVYVWEMDGKLMSQIPTSASNVFSLATSERNEKTILTAGGASCKINVCSNFKYNDFCLTIQ